METNKRRVISLLVDNQSGVLARVSSLFCRRGFNIDSLTVSATNDPAVSRITVTITSDEKALSQLILQTERLEVTRQVFVLDGEKSLHRPTLMAEQRLSALMVYARLKASMISASKPNPLPYCFHDSEPSSKAFVTG